MIALLRGRLAPIIGAGVGMALFGGAVLAGFVGVSVMAGFGWEGLAAAIVLLIGAVVLMVVPVHWLPAIALLAMCLIPLRLVPADGPFNAVPPLSVIMPVWVLRRLVLGQAAPVDGPAPIVARAGTRYALWVAAVFFLLWCLFGLTRTTQYDTSVGWIIAITIGALCVLLVPDARAEVALLRPALLWTLAALACYAVAELLVQSSPLYDAIYGALGVVIEKPWSVYRAAASFGHPLFAGAMFALGAGLGIGGWLSGAPRQHLVLGAICAIGVVATVSRGSILALGIAGGLAVVLAAIVPGPHRDARLLLAGFLGAVAIAAVSNFAPLQQREGSLESDLSAGARDTGLWVGLEAARRADWLGAGPGMSGVAGRQIYDVIIENSILQLLVSIGIPGLLLFLVVMGLAALVALQRRDLGAVAAIAAYLGAITGFNSIDALRAMHLVLGALLLLALHPVAGIGVERATAPVRRGESVWA